MVEDIDQGLLKAVPDSPFDDNGYPSLHFTKSFAKKSIGVVSWEGYKRINEAEEGKARECSSARPRVKIESQQELLRLGIGALAKGDGR